MRQIVAVRIAPRRLETRSHMTPVRIVLVSVALGACAGEEAAKPCVEYVADESTLPAADFERDVMPIFHRSCGRNALCHGLPTNLPFLGSSPAQPGDADAVHAAIVNRPAGAAPARLFVAPGDPKNSFLMRKTDGDQCLWD